MDKIDENTFIITNSNMYFDTQDKSLEERIKSINLDKDYENEVRSNATLNIVKDKFLGSFKIGEVISTILEWSDDVNNQVKEAKKSVLLDEYLNKIDKQEDSINKLKQFITQPKGNVLFNKILMILEDYPPDLELIAHLAKALRYMVNNDNFGKMFEQHKFALSQIEKLTPQALTILADYKNYPTFNLGMSMTFGIKVTSEWHDKFIEAYCNRKNITSIEMKSRIAHTIVQLESQGYIEAFKKDDNTIVCEVSQIGKDLMPYIEV